MQSLHTWPRVFFLLFIHEIMGSVFSIRAFVSLLPYQYFIDRHQQDIAEADDIAGIGKQRSSLPITKHLPIRKAKQRSQFPNCQIISFPQCSDLFPGFFCVYC